MAAAMRQQPGILAEILRNKFSAVVDDMCATLVNTAYSEFISEGHEYAVGLFTETGELLATENALQMCSLSETVANILDYFQFDLAANDIIITNDPYGGGVRVQDFTVLAPLTYEDNIVMHIAVRARMADIGGELLGSLNPLAKEIWAEGARITAVKLVRDGKLQKDVLTTILLNSRLPDAFRLDLDAMMAAVNVGKQRLNELLQVHGESQLSAAAQWSLQYAQRRFAAEISTWPAGEYTGASRLVHDCQGRRNLTVRAALKVEEGQLKIDLSDSDEQTTAFVNSTYANTCGYALLPILSIVDETLPRNSGILRNAKIVTRKGTVVHPEYPAPTGWSRHHVGSEIAAAVTSALSSLLPDRVSNVTASLPLAYAIERVMQHGGTVEQVNFNDYSTFCQGQCDAAEGRDGWGMPGVFAERALPSVEVSEIEGRGHVEKLELAIDSGGPGRWRGGLGTELQIHLPQRSNEMLLTVCLESADSRELGGGCSGMQARACLSEAADAQEIEDALINHKIGGDVNLYLRMSGGSGVGRPSERNPQAVLRDVLNGYVSPDAALRDYKVVIEEDSMTIDQNATDLIRSK